MDTELFVIVPELIVLNGLDKNDRNICFTYLPDL